MFRALSEWSGVAGDDGVASAAGMSGNTQCSCGSNPLSVYSANNSVCSSFTAISILLVVII